MLWRIDNGELDGYSAKAIVLMIGTNNSTRDSTYPWETALGVKAILARIRERQPQAKIILTAIFPRGRGVDDKGHAEARARNDRTNEILKTFADGEKVVWLDISDRLADPETKWTTPAMFPDRIHPSDAAYRIWLSALAEAVDCAFAAKTERQGPVAPDEKRDLRKDPEWEKRFREEKGSDKIATGTPSKARQN